MPVETLIPHRKPMCLLDRLIEIKDQGGTVEASVPHEHALIAGDGRLDSLAVAEMIAQSYAAVKGSGLQVIDSRKRLFNHESMHHDFPICPSGFAVEQRNRIS